MKFSTLHAFDSTPWTSFYGASTQPDTGYGSKVAGRLPLVCFRLSYFYRHDVVLTYVLSGAGKCSTKYEMGLWECTAAFPSPVASASLGQGTQLMRLGIVLCLEYFSFKIRITPSYAYLRCRAAEQPRHFEDSALAHWRLVCIAEYRELWPSYGRRCIILLLGTPSPRHISRKSPASYTPILPHGGLLGMDRWVRLLAGA